MVPMVQSPVWKYFTKCNGLEAICSICMKQIRTGGGTTNLRSHLKTKHPDLPLDNKDPISTKTEVVTEIIIPEMQLTAEEGKEQAQFTITTLDQPVLVKPNNNQSPTQKQQRKRKRITGPPACAHYPYLQDVDRRIYKSSPSDDKFDIIGKNVAHKLRDLAPETSLITEKLISDILYEAATGNINKQSRINIFDSDTTVAMS